MLHARIAAIRSDGTFIRNDLREIDANVFEAVRARKNLRPDDAAERFVARKRAAIVHVARFDGGDYAVFIERDARIEKGALVAVRAGQQMFGARFGPFHRDGRPVCARRARKAPCKDNS